MNFTDNKKAQDFGEQGLNVVNTGISTMNIVAEKTDLQHTLTGEQTLDLVEVDIGGNKQFAVDARSLHLFLESKRKFSDWIKSRLIKYGFIENEDFILASQNCEAKHGGHNKSDYYLTLDVAKELSMVENNDKGREARRYFIRCEKLAFEAMKEKFMGNALETRKVISPEQKDSLQKIVDAKVNGNHGLRAQVWTRHNRHFKINSYHELLAIHFEDSVQYLLGLELKGKPEKHDSPDIVAQLDEYLKNINSRFPALKSPYAYEAAMKIAEDMEYRNVNEPQSYFVSFRNGKVITRWLEGRFYPVDMIELSEIFEKFNNFSRSNDLMDIGRNLKANATT